MERRKLGRTGLEVGRLGISAGYGVPAMAVDSSFERGVNYLYWGSRRTPGFAQALRNLTPQDVCMTGPSTAEHAEEAPCAAELGTMSEEELARMRRAGAAIHGK
jgi:hypothetical protein